MKFYSHFLMMIVVKVVLVVFFMTGMSMVDAFAQTNLITNGDFEIDANPADSIPDNWNLNPSSGTGSTVELEGSNTFIANDADYSIAQQMLSIEDVAGKTFIFSFDVKSLNGAATVGDCLMIKLDDDSYIYPHVTPWNNPVGTDWASVSGGYTCPDNAVEIIGILIYRANQTGALCVDNVSMALDGEWNPVGLWNFDKLGSAVAVDMSNHGFHGTINGAQRVAHSSGYCLQFDGVNDYLEFHIERDEPIAEGTFEVWAKPNLTGYWESAQYGTRKGDVLRSASIIICMYDTFWLAVVWDGLNMSTIQGPTVIDNTWTHLAITWSGFTARFYVNGQEYEGKLGPMKYADFLLVDYMGKTNVDFFVGIQTPDSSSSKGAFNGHIDDLILYRRTLSAAEILQRAQSQ